MQKNPSTYNTILSFGDLVEVVEPEWLKEKIKKLAKTIYEKYWDRIEWTKDDKKLSWIIVYRIVKTYSVYKHLLRNYLSISLCFLQNLIE